MLRGVLTPTLDLRAPCPPLALRDAGATERRDVPAATADEGTDEGARRWFACRACRARIAPVSALFAVDGRTDHVRHNPHGLVFHIRCLRRAPGARAVGIATTEHTWFAGHGWRIALCAGCGAHLGWGFEGPRRFWGLIADRLVEVDEVP